MLCQCKCFYFLSGDQVRSSDWSNTSQWSFVAHVQTRSAHCQNILSRVLEFLMSRYWFVVEWNIPESLVLGQIRSWGQNRIRVSSSLSHKFETWYLEWETSTAAILFWHVHHWLHFRWNLTRIPRVSAVSDNASHSSRAGEVFPEGKKLSPMGAPTTSLWWCF